VCACGHHFQQIGHQLGVVANRACGQLNRENGIFPSQNGGQDLQKILKRMKQIYDI